MLIEAGTVVTLAYDLRDCDGDPLEQPEASVAYLHGGFDGIFPKVEEALTGREPGFELALTLEPDDAFGDYDAELLRVEARERFPETLEVGMQFEGMPGGNEDEALIYTVTDVAKDTVVVDGNHPYAGERVWFHCTVREVRRASSEEISLGHAISDAGLSTK